jgi:polyribonucleotide nucleotidyltransferase
LLHISEIDYTRTERVEDFCNVGDVIRVKVIEIDPEGKIRLSRKALLPKPEGYTERPPRRDGPRRDNRSGNDYRRRSPSR